MISIIIPTYNEVDCIKSTIQKLWAYDQNNLIQEIIVSDGGSTDGTVQTAGSEGVQVIISPVKGRAAQMNYAAQYARGKILYFLHADTLPPKSFSKDIQMAIRKGFGAGCYMLSFDFNHWFLKANCWFTRFNVDTFRFGDQSLFVTKEVFNQAGGFCEKHIILEDQHIIKKLKKVSSFRIIKKPVLTSARKYLENGIFKTQGIYFLIYFLYRLGFPQQKLLATYRHLIWQDKL